MIEIKNSAVLKGFLLHRFHVKLATILCWMLDNIPRGVYFTESFRHELHPGDLHSTRPVRAVDIRSWIYKDPLKVAEAINKKWIYDPERPEMEVAKYHGNRKGHGYHIHIQVHGNTVWRDAGINR